MRTADLLDAGCSVHTLRLLLESGSVFRPGRGWVALPEADPLLLTAAKNASALTCVTQARRYGLWDMGDSTLHLAPFHKGSRVSREHIAHWARPVQVRPVWSLEDPIQNVLAHVAACRPFEEALAIWESAAHQGLVTLQELRRLPYSGVARRLLTECTPYSDSGLETYFRARTKRLGVRVTYQVFLAGHFVDFLIGDFLVVQIDGGTHVGAQRISDNEHDAQLNRLGYTVIRVGYEQVMHRWPDVFEMILSAISQGLHLRR